MKGQILFSAPFDFLPEDLKAAYNEYAPTTFREIWKREELARDESITAWVMNPGQNFVIDAAVLDLFPNIEVLSTPSTGTNHINLDVCKARGVPVYSLLDNRNILNSISASAEFSFLLLLNTLRRLDFAIGEASSGRWRAGEDQMRGFELAGKKVGLVGYGRIGKRLARWCQAFDADVVFFDPYVEANENAAKVDSLERVFSESDIVCVCCVLTDETRGMIGTELLSLLKDRASLVNTSRGEVINEKELAQLLDSRPDLRVGLDVIAGEVSGAQYDSPLFRFQEMGQIVITPHIAGATFESQSKAALGALELLKQHYSDL